MNEEIKEWKTQSVKHPKRETQGSYATDYGWSKFQVHRCGRHRVHRTRILCSSHG